MVDAPTAGEFAWESLIENRAADVQRIGRWTSTPVELTRLPERGIGLTLRTPEMVEWA